MTIEPSPKGGLNHIRISAKYLGALALPNSCLRCFWLKLHLRHRLPYQIFPGIFSSIDGFTKRVVHAYFGEHGVLLTGAADGILVRDDASFVIVDYKTA